MMAMQEKPAYSSLSAWSILIPFFHAFILKNMLCLPHLLYPCYIYIIFLTRGLTSMQQDVALCSADCIFKVHWLLYLPSMITGKPLISFSFIICSFGIV